MPSPAPREEKQTAPRRHGRDRFQAFAVPCGAPSEAAALVESLVKKHGLSDASHLSWALRAGLRGGSMAEAKSDGGETGAGNCILDVMRKKGTAGLLVLVARWYGGRHLGALRFRIYRDLTAEAAGGPGAATPLRARDPS
jgi:putative IMPACT (imprinted ancient) family translation regulator